MFGHDKLVGRTISLQCLPCDYSDERETTGGTAVDIVVPEVQRVRKRAQAQFALH